SRRADSSGGSGGRGAAVGNRVGIRQRLGDCLMTTRAAFLTVIAILFPAAFTMACGRRSEPARTEPPSLNLTDWTDTTELYMEYPPLVAGRPAVFAVHLTRLSDFTPLTAGRTRIEFTPEHGGSPTVFTGREPSRPGAFRVEGAPPSPGRY